MRHAKHILWVLDRCKGPRLPEKAAILLEKAFQRTAAGSAVKPYRNVVGRRSDSWLKHEKQCPRCVARIDWYQSGVQLTDVEVDNRQ